MQVKFDIKCDRLPRRPTDPSPVVQVPSLSRATFMSQACAAVPPPPPFPKPSVNRGQDLECVGAARLGKPRVASVSPHTHSAFSVAFSSACLTQLQSVRYLDCRRRLFRSLGYNIIRTGLTFGQVQFKLICLVPCYPMYMYDGVRSVCVCVCVCVCVRACVRACV